MAAEHAALDQAIETALDERRFDAAATETIRGYGPQLLGYLRATLRDPVDADEAFAMCCADLWQALPHFRRECRMRVWVYRLAWTAAMRVAGDTYRRKRRRLATGELSALVEQVRSQTVPHQRSSVRDAVTRLRDELATEDRALLILKVDRRLSWSEIAEVLAQDGTPVAEVTLRKRYERIKQRLKKLGERAGLL